MRRENTEPSHKRSPTARSLGQGSAWREEALDCGWNSLHAGGAEILWAFLQEWAVGATAEPSKLGRKTAQRCGYKCLVVGIPDRETKPRSQAAP